MSNAVTTSDLSKKLSIDTRGAQMGTRNGNYVAFYVAEPFNPSALGAHATKDFCYYNLLRSWKGADSSFPFNDSKDIKVSRMRIC